MIFYVDHCLFLKKSTKPLLPRLCQVNTYLKKLKALGLPEDALAEGWWIGFHVTDESVWKKVKDGTYSMFSIEGEAIREEVEGNAK